LSQRRLEALAALAEANLRHYVVLLILILISVSANCLETVQPIPNAYRLQMEFLEWIITILLVYIGLLVVDTPSFEVLRPLRLLQAFRVFKLGWDWPHGSQFSASLSTTLWRIEP
jgi:predicted permease